MTQHVRLDAAETCPFASFFDEVVDGLTRHRLATLGDDQPRQVVVALCEVAFDGAQLMTLDRLLGVEEVLERRTQIRACCKFN